MGNPKEQQMNGLDATRLVVFVVGSVWIGATILLPAVPTSAASHVPFQSRHHRNDGGGGSVFSDNVAGPDPEHVYKFLDGVSLLTGPNRNEDQDIDDDSTSVATTTFGYSDYPNQIPMAPDSHFPIGSNSKLFTAVAIYQLQEQGKLDVTADIADMLDETDFANFGWLDGKEEDDEDDTEDTVSLSSSVRLGGDSTKRKMMKRKRKLCPKLPHHPLKCQTITLEQILSMSSGIYPELSCNAPTTSDGQCNPVAWIISQGSIGRTVGSFLNEPLIFEPGTQYHYSNPNFVLAAYFVEKYSGGMTFRKYLETNIFARIGLKNTYFDFFNGMVQLDPQRVHPYFKYYNNESLPEADLLAVGNLVVQTDVGVSSGSGGIVSTVQDIAKFWHVLFNKTSMGAPLLQSPDSYRAILKPWIVSDHSTGTWNGTTVPVWAYYTQGCSIICTEANCPNGPRWIAYTGGVVNSVTANVFDFSDANFGAMAQVWTSTLVTMTDKASFDAAFEDQIGYVGSIVDQWYVDSYNDPSTLAWEMLFEKFPPVGNTSPKDDAVTEEDFEQISRAA